MIHHAIKGQTSYGEAIGILLLDSRAPFIHGDVGNARSYPYPVRFKRIDGLTVERIFAHDLGFIEKMVEGARELEREGVKAITGDCGFMAIYQSAVKAAVNIPVLLSSLIQIPLIQATLPDTAKVGVITADSRSLTFDVFRRIGIDETVATVIFGLENQPHFKAAALDEIGVLDSDRIREEVTAAALRMTAAHPEVRSILLECSMLPPYGEAVSRATGLPVYDFLTMIDYVYSALIKRRFEDSI